MFFWRWWYHGRIACTKHRSVSLVENMKVFFSFPNLYVFYIFIHFWLTPIDDRGIFIEDHIPKRPDRSLTGSRFLSALYGMWSSTEIPLFKLFILVNFSHMPGSHKTFSLWKISISIILGTHDTKIYPFSRVLQFYTKEGVHKVY